MPETLRVLFCYILVTSGEVPNSSGGRGEAKSERKGVALRYCVTPQAFSSVLSKRHRDLYINLTPNGDCPTSHKETKKTHTCITRISLFEPSTVGRVQAEQKAFRRQKNSLRNQLRRMLFIFI